jgi:Asp-tRNA(Asn)/Glu-tRNA(Gln) amidotransferase A subunit family amidase
VLTVDSGASEYITRARVRQYAGNPCQGNPRNRAGGANAKIEAYAQGLRGVKLARREIAKVFDSVNLLIMPTTNGTAGLIPQPAQPVGGGAPVAGGGPAGFRNTSYFSYFGVPAISIPCGFTAAGLPIGLEIAGAAFAESTVLALAHDYEQATEWHTKHPSLDIVDSEHAEKHPTYTWAVRSG